MQHAPVRMAGAVGEKKLFRQWQGWQKARVAIEGITLHGGFHSMALFLCEWALWAVGNRAVM